MLNSLYTQLARLYTPFTETPYTLGGKAWQAINVLYQADALDPASAWFTITHRHELERLGLMICNLNSWADASRCKAFTPSLDDIRFTANEDGYTVEPLPILKQYLAAHPDDATLIQELDAHGTIRAGELIYLFNIQSIIHCGDAHAEQMYLDTYHDGASIHTLGRIRESAAEQHTHYQLTVNALLHHIFHPNASFSEALKEGKPLTWNELQDLFPAAHAHGMAWHRWDDIQGLFLDVEREMRGALATNLLMAKIEQHGISIPEFHARYITGKEDYIPFDSLPDFLKEKIENIKQEILHIEKDAKNLFNWGNLPVNWSSLQIEAYQKSGIPTLKHWETHPMPEGCTAYIPSPPCSETSPCTEEASSFRLHQLPQATTQRA
jgi:hypothetical protein